MKYFIAHLLSGDAAAFHEGVTRELSARFGTFPLHERVPPHLTVKTPFETDEHGILEIERILRAFATHERAESFMFRGFGKFGFRTAYLDVPRGAPAVSLVRRLLTTLAVNAPWLPRNPREGNKLHASVARFMTRRQSRHVWRHFKGVRPVFFLSLDNLAILEKNGRAWRVRALIPLPAERGDEYAGFAIPAAARAATAGAARWT
ncbi:MAG: 2'-5' RNA ligase family protein [Patescibacteria group bacterium]|nr:2'-5' RNA ligase family protein [Patescibacteria group bacterium]